MPNKKPNRADATLRNVRAANKKLVALERRVKALEALHATSLRNARAK